MSLPRLVLCACLLLSATLQAADEDAAPVAGQAAATEEQQQPGPEPARPARPVPSFTPSEEISADSAVSFPVDI